MRLWILAGSTLEAKTSRYEVTDETQAVRLDDATVENLSKSVWGLDEDATDQNCNCGG